MGRASGAGLQVPWSPVSVALSTERSAAVTRAEKRLAVAYCRHAVESMASGYFACFCGCGYRGVCRHCVPNAPLDIPWMLCDEARALVQAGQARCEDGYVYAISN